MQGALQVWYTDSGKSEKGERGLMGPWLTVLKHLI